MSADMLVAVLAVPAFRKEPLDFAAASDALEKITEVDAFRIDDPESQLDEILGGFDTFTHLEADGSVSLELAKTNGHKILERLTDALDTREVSTIIVGDYRLYISGGLSSGDAPTEAAQAIWNTCILPDRVLLALGVIPNFGKPLGRRNGLRRGVTDADVVDAIALGLGTQETWSGADDLEWIADLVGKVREHPGDADPAGYLQCFRDRYEFDPTTSRFLDQYICIEDTTEADDQDEED